MMKWLLTILLIFASPTILAQEVEQSFNAKNWQQIVQIYERNKKADFSAKEMVMISYALRKTGQFRKDININVRYLYRFFKPQHLKLLQEIKTGASTDPEEYAIKQKIAYWNIVNNYAQFIQSVQTKSDAVEKDFKHFQYFAKMLESLEFRQGKADKLISTVQSHMLYLEDKIYRFSSSLQFNYVSWQREVDLTGAETAKLLVTNRGYCIGGDAGIENYRYHFFVDGCLLMGSGGINNKDAQPEYQQSNVLSYGFKGGPGASLIVSSSKSRIGVKFPLIYTVQDFAQPETTASGDKYSVKQKNPLSLQTSLYSRFNLGTWFIQTEFGQYIGNDEIFWGIGFGKQF